MMAFIWILTTMSDAASGLHRLEDTLTVEMRGLHAQIESHKETIKRLNTSIGHINNSIEETSRLIEDGFEFRPVECIRFKSYRTKCWVFVSKQTHLEVCREPFLT